jgi:hypothetical protein
MPEDISLNSVAYAKIFPPIGIARVGNSKEPDGFFIAPEWPDERRSADRAFRYKDEAGAIKRQACRFRVYGFDKNGKVVAELTSRNASITWVVSLANRKAEWFAFDGARRAILHFLNPDHEPSARISGNRARDFIFRNSDIGRPKKGAQWDRALRRKLLAIDGGEQRISGVNRGHSTEEQGEWKFCGSFLEKNKVYLGELCTDSDGRLLVLGGLGVSAGYDQEGRPDPNNWIKHYANNDFWHDDTSDGPVEVEVILKNGRRIEVAGAARVIVTPPDFAPDTSNLVTLFDAMLQATVDHGLDPRELRGLLPDGYTEFWRDIYPIMAAVDGYTWVSGIALRGHGANKPGEFLTDDVLAAISDPRSSDGGRQRTAVFKMIRTPSRPDGDTDENQKRRTLQANTYFMPPLSGDEGDRVDGEPDTWLTVTRLQYEHLERWAHHRFKTGDRPERPRLPPLLQDQPMALTRNSLERCVGGAFFPGIEMTAIVRLKELYDDGFRLSRTLEPGAISRHMACPWQADFFECNTTWWPGQRPDEVVNEFDLDQVREQFPTERLRGELANLLFPRQAWARGLQSERPGYQHLLLQCVLKVEPNESTNDYFERQIGVFERAWGDTAFSAIADLSLSPWRVQFVRQEILDRYGDRHIQFRFPSPEEFLTTLPQIKNLSEAIAQLRARWPAIPGSLDMSADKLLTSYLEFAAEEFSGKVREMLAVFKETASSASKLFQTFSGLISNPPQDPVSEVPFGRERFAGLAFFELCQAVADMQYEDLRSFSGDNGMVKLWSSLGFVVERRVPKQDGKETVVRVETERSLYDGMLYRDYFYILMNLEKYPGFFDYARKIVDRILDQAGSLIQRLVGNDTSAGNRIIETAFDYSPTAFAAKLEEIYEFYRRAGASEQPWLNDNTHLETIRWRLLRSAQFNQIDGGWLRFVSDAGPIDEIHALLFDIWSDEVGNGDPSLHHGNLFTALLRSLGVYLPDLASAEYANSPLLREEDFLNPVFQLSISQHARRYFAELLGMTLFLEWEVLDLVASIKRLDYLGFDTQFWRMHVGIDNAAVGHGAKARRAVELHLANVLSEGGEAALQDEWKRIWRGFVAFATADLGYLDADADVERRRHPLVPSRIAQVISRKSHYAKLNHRGKRLGPDRLNDLFDDPDQLLAALKSSQFVSPGRPDDSRLLNYLTTFYGPMYKVFDQSDLRTWKEWIEWLGSEGHTGRSTTYFNKEEAMKELLKYFAQTAAAQSGHQRHRLKLPSKQEPEDLASIFRELLSKSNNLEAFMRAIADPANGYIMPYAPELSTLVVEYLHASRPMGRALDRRFPDINNQIGRKIVVDWITAGCPVGGKPSPGQHRFRPAPTGYTTLVIALGKGSIH